jgi:uncharacterized protein YjbJ (UPF0337 family)
MDWNHLKRAWKQTKGTVQQKWNKLTDDDLELINGSRDRLEVKIQQRYGFAPSHARKEIDDWVRWQVPVRSQSRSRLSKSQLALAPMNNGGDTGPSGRGRLSRTASMRLARTA